MKGLQEVVGFFWLLEPYYQVALVMALLGGGGILGWITGLFKLFGKIFKSKPPANNPVFGSADAAASVTSASVGEIAKQLVEQAGLRAHAEGRAEAAEQEIASLKNTIEEIETSLIPAMAEAAAEQEITSLKETIAEMAASPIPAMAEALAKLQDGDTEAAETLFQKIASEEEQAGADKNKQAAHAYRNLGNIAFLHNTQKALRDYAKATELDPDDPDGWNMLGVLQKRLGLLDAAITSLEKVLALGNHAGDKTVIAMALGNLAMIYQTQGDLNRAEEMLYKSLALNEELDRKEGMANQYGNLGVIYVARDDLERAEEMFQKVLVIEQELGRKESKANAYGNLCPIYLMRGDFNRAEEMLFKSLALNEELGHKEGMAIQYANLGTLYQKKGDMTSACVHWQKAKKIFTEMEMKPQIEKVEAQMRKANCPSS